MEDKSELILSEIKEVFEELTLKKVESFDKEKILFEEISSIDLLVKEPVLSVLVITYNHSEYIAEAIDGIVNQLTSVPFEVIIGEDCSLDNTREVVLEYQKKYPDKIRVIVSKENVGATKNIFRIFNIARGKFISICEGDDYWYDMNKIQQQVDFLENNLDVGLIHCAADIYEQKSKTFLSKIRDGVVGKNIITNVGISPANRIFTCSVCFRREILSSLYEMTPMIFFNFMFLDRIIWNSAILNSKTCYMPFSMTVYRVIEGSASHFRENKRGAMFAWQLSSYMLYFFEKHHKKEINFEHNDARQSYYETMSELGYKYLSKKTSVRALSDSKNNNVVLATKFLLMNYYVVHPVLRTFIYPVLLIKRILNKFIH